MSRALVVTAVVGVLAVVFTMRAAADPATRSCANPALPSTILEGSAASHRSPELRTIDVAAGSQTLRLAIARTPKDRELGLMCVTALRRNAGMLFVFPASQEWDFWMKNTLIPLDMIWLDEAGKVTAVARDVPASTLEEPDDEVARRTGPGRYVIELRANSAQRLGLSVGEKLALPALHASE